MGATSFITEAKGKTAREAFFEAIAHAEYTHGHSGYSGTIMEKSEYVMITVPTGFVGGPRGFARHLIDQDDHRISDKWGPAGCIDQGDGSFVFFGFAST